jgi:hypothetical protein
MKFLFNVFGVVLTVYFYKFIYSFHYGAIRISHQFSRIRYRYLNDNLFHINHRYAKRNHDDIMINNNSDDEADDTKFITLNDLKLQWTQSGRKLIDFNEKTALLLFYSDDDDDYENDRHDQEHSKSNNIRFDAKKMKDITNEMMKSVGDGQLLASKTSRTFPRDINFDTQSRAASRNHIDSNIATESSPNPLEGRSIGIDLGTTFSAVSVIEAGMPRIIPIDGHRIIPSIVGCDSFY